MTRYSKEKVSEETLDMFSAGSCVKKIFCAFLCLCLFACLTGCSSDPRSEKIEKVLIEQNYSYADTTGTPSSGKYYQTEISSSVLGQQSIAVKDCICANTVSPELVVSNITYVEFSTEQNALNVIQNQSQAFKALVEDSCKRNKKIYTDDYFVGFKIDMADKSERNATFVLICKSGKSVIYIKATGPKDQLKQNRDFYIQVCKTAGLDMTVPIKQTFIEI